MCPAARRAGPRCRPAKLGRSRAGAVGDGQQGEVDGDHPERRVSEQRRSRRRAGFQTRRMSALALREPLDLTGVAESLAISVRGHFGSLPIANDRFSAQGWKNQIRFCAQWSSSRPFLVRFLLTFSSPDAFAPRVTSHPRWAESDATWASMSSGRMPVFVAACWM